MLVRISHGFSVAILPTFGTDFFRQMAMDGLLDPVVGLGAKRAFHGQSWDIGG